MVQLYEHDAYLLDTLFGFIGTGLADGNTCIVLATSEHQEGLESRLRASGIDLDRAEREGRYLAPDSATLMAGCTVSGRPSVELLAEQIAGVLTRAAESGRPLRAFGEIVSVLCAQGEHGAALQLEERWNHLMTQYPVALLCAYRLADLATQGAIAPFLGICDCHGRVFPAESYALATSQERLLAVGLMQQRSAALDDAIERRTLAEAALRKSEVHETLTQAAEPILMCGPEGRIVFANRTACEMFGYDRDEMLAFSVEELIPERMRELHRQDRDRFLSAPEPEPVKRLPDLIAVRKNGTEFPIEVTLSAVRAASGELSLAFVISDVTQQKEAERTLRQYQTKVQDMAFDAALVEARERRRIAADLHDGLGQSLALAQIKLTSLRAMAAGDLRTALDEAILLVQQAVADSRSLMFDLSPPILYDLGLPAALTWLAEQMETRHGLHVELDGGTESIQELESDVAALLFRAVRELLMNVVKHAHTTRAAVSILREANEIHIQVKDDGDGFDSSLPLSLPLAKGTGFGLFSVREQIARLGGVFEARSLPGAGTTVTLRVPLSESIG